MALSPESLARAQGILDGTIKPAQSKPIDPSEVSPEVKAELAKIWDEAFAIVQAEQINQPPIPQPVYVYEDEDSMHQEEPDAEELRNADEVIETLAKAGHGDYSAFRREIALDIYANGHYAGNDTVSFIVSDYDADSTLQDFTVIQEDHYDQHMDEDPDKPSWDDMVAEVSNGYLWMS